MLKTFPGSRPSKGFVGLLKSPWFKPYFIVIATQINVSFIRLLESVLHSEPHAVFKYYAFRTHIIPDSFKLS